MKKLTVLLVAFFVASAFGALTLRLSPVGYQGVTEDGVPYYDNYAPVYLEVTVFSDQPSGEWVSWLRVAVDAVAEDSPALPRFVPVSASVFYWNWVLGRATECETFPAMIFWAPYGVSYWVPPTGTFIGNIRYQYDFFGMTTVTALPVCKGGGCWAWRYTPPAQYKTFIPVTGGFCKFLILDPLR